LIVINADTGGSMQILVVGPSGFIVFAVAARLTPATEEVAGVRHGPPPYHKSNHIELDITSQRHPVTGGLIWKASMRSSIAGPSAIVAIFWLMIAKPSFAMV
jgi:nucleoside-diphosphate-sugar epimerase